MNGPLGFGVACLLACFVYFLALLIGTHLDGPR